MWKMPLSGDDYLRHGVRCAIGVRGAHCIKFSTRTDQRVLRFSLTILVARQVLCIVTGYFAGSASRCRGPARGRGFSPGSRPPRGEGGTAEMGHKAPL